MIIGITGNSGSGKSEIAKIIAKKIGAQIIDADKVVKELSEPGQEYYEKVVELFSKDILNNNRLNKAKIAEIIYNNEAKREKLNRITYKYIVDEIKKRALKGEKTIIDAPLLFESNLDRICDYTIAVLADEDIKIRRICKRDKIDINTAKARLQIQNNNEYYLKRANNVIKNNGDLNEINVEDICIEIGKN